METYTAGFQTDFIRNESCSTLKIINQILPCVLAVLCSRHALPQPTPTAAEQRIDQVSTSPAWWTQLGGTSTHGGSSGTPQTSGSHLSHPRWISDGDGDVALDFTPQAGVVADDMRVYAMGTDQSFTHYLAAFNHGTGELAWASEIPFALLDSWSMPAIDLNNDTVLVATGFSLAAFNRYTGDQVWSTGFSQPLVNASPCVTHDLDDSNRVFITDYSFGSGANGSLTCINLDPFDTDINPYTPGEVIWSIHLSGNCSGNTPAYHDGVVYVSTADDGFGGPGHVLAFDATTIAPPTPLWDTSNPEPYGYYSAVTYSNGHVFGSSYNFNGLQRSANTIKIDATTGDIQWSIPTVRTDASPIILANGNIVISGGIPTSPSSFFTGSLPAIQLIEDLGTSAIFLWDSFQATHQDLNDSGTWDPGEPFLSIGGWGHHPIAFQNHGPQKLLVGTMTPPTGLDPFSHASGLHTIDLSKHPADPGFIISTQPNTGTTPAIIGNLVLSTSAEGITALSLGPPPRPQPLVQHIRDIVDGIKPFSSLRPEPHRAP